MYGSRDNLNNGPQRQTGRHGNQKNMDAVFRLSKEQPSLVGLGKASVLQILST